MRIALMTNNYKPYIGGVPISIERLKTGLEALGHRVVVFAPAYDEQEEAEDECRFSTLTRHFYAGTVLPNPLDPRIEERFKREAFDIIHVHHPVFIGRTAVYLSRKYRIPLVYTYHTRYEEYLSYAAPIRFLEKGAERETFFGQLQKDVLYVIREKLTRAYLGSFFKQCDLIFAPTAGMKEYFDKRYQYLQIPTAVLPTGLEEAFFQRQEQKEAQIRREAGAEEIPLFVTVARMGHEKNIEFLLRSAAAFKESYGKPFRFLLIGDGPERSRFCDIAEQLGIREEVRFLGQVDNQEIPAYMAAADAFLFASKTETQGIVILEAFASGTPVIALRASGVEDLVEDSVNGFLVEKELEEEFAKKLLCFLQDHSIRQAMESAARETAKHYKETQIAYTALRNYGTIWPEAEEEPGRAGRSPHINTVLQTGLRHTGVKNAV